MDSESLVVDEYLYTQSRGNMGKRAAFSAVWYWIRTQKSEEFLEENRAIDSNERKVVSSDG